MDITGAYGVKPSVTPVPTPKQEKPKVDVSGVAVGSAVRHGKFGDGKVIAMDSKYITIQFAEGEKRFIFPDAFENGFLKL